MMAAAARSSASEAASLRRLREAERRRLSRLLHDETGPLLCSAGLAAELLRGTLGAAAPQQEELFAKLAGALESAVSSVRLLSQEAAPGLAARRGLEDALRLLAEAHGAELRITARPGPLPARRADALCELVRDALLALEGGAARITVLGDVVRIEAPQPAVAGVKGTLRAAARAAGLRVQWRAQAEQMIMEIRMGENG